MASDEMGVTKIHVAAEIFAITYWIPHADDELEEAKFPFQGFLPADEHLLVLTMWLDCPWTFVSYLLKGLMFYLRA